jgi:hypothetical protein
MKNFNETELKKFITKIVTESVNDKKEHKNRFTLKKSEFKNILENSIIQILKEDYGYNILNPERLQIMEQELINKEITIVTDNQNKFRGLIKFIDVTKENGNPPKIKLELLISNGKNMKIETKAHLDYNTWRYSNSIDKNWVIIGDKRNIPCSINPDSLFDKIWNYISNVMSESKKN